MKALAKGRWPLAWVLVLALVLAWAAAAPVRADAPRGLVGKWKLVEGSPGIHLGLIYFFDADHSGRTVFLGNRTIHWKWRLERDRLSIQNPDGSGREHTLTWLGRHRFKLEGKYGFIVLQRQ